MDPEIKQSILDRDKTIWIATLESGEEVWQRIDLEQDTEGYSSWLELRQTKLKIIGLKIKFRSHIEELPSNAQGYYFRRGIIATMPGGDEANCYVTGYIENGILHKIWWRIPEIIEWDAEVTDTWNKEDLGIILNEIPIL
jgi:hypothetical protein